MPPTAHTRAAMDPHAQEKPILYLILGWNKIYLNVFNLGLKKLSD